MNTIFHILTNVIKVVKNQTFQKSLTSHETNQTILFLSLTSQDPKPKWNHQIVSSRAKTKSRQSQTFVNYRGNIIWIKRNTDVNKSDLIKLHKNIKLRLIFHTLSSISPKHYVFFLSSYEWLESYGCHGSFGTYISGTLSFSPVL